MSKKTSQLDAAFIDFARSLGCKFVEVKTGVPLVDFSEKKKPKKKKAKVKK